MLIPSHYSLSSWRSLEYGMLAGRVQSGDKTSVRLKVQSDAQGAVNTGGRFVLPF